MSALALIERRSNWWKIFVVIFAVSVSVVGYVGYQTYHYAPPITDFVAEDGAAVFAAEDIVAGQQVFFRRGLMEYGSFLGDGALRGPDFTAEALNFTARAMNEFHDARARGRFPQAGMRAPVVQSLVQSELKENRYDADYYQKRGMPHTARYQPGAVVLSPAQAHAFAELTRYYTEKFGAGGPLAGAEVFTPSNSITNAREIKQLTAFFFWGAWLCAAKRPGGYDYSYTHNWPYDPLAGNTPHGGLVFWSTLGTLVVILTLGALFYYYGRIDREGMETAEKARLLPPATRQLADSSRPTPTQRAIYKFFAVAALLFGVQIVAGLLAIGDFVGLVRIAGIDVTRLLPVTVTRAWHTQISLLWIAVCWFAATIWVLPLICRPEPRGQLRWVNALFWLLVLVGAGTAFGIPLGIQGALSEFNTRWLGLQGWEFMEIGRLYQYLLYLSFLVWMVIVVRGVWPALRQRQTWSLPNWTVYMIAGIILMFTASFVAKPDTNFVVADFWRWCTVHMWVEAFFELFTTVIVAYFMYLMGFVSHLAAARVVYFGAVLFLGSGLIGISHNFYWNAKSIETVALGSVFSSLQVAPLILLTVEAWRFRRMPQDRLAETGGAGGFGLSEAFLFLIGVNFWNFLGAGVLGFMINLPIVNYYEHGTYLTVNHGHAALMGVYGNLAIAAMIFCARWLVGPRHWNARLLRTAFWSLNVGLGLMVVMDLFPVGLHQLAATMSRGLAYARSAAYVHGSVFQSLTWLRGVGVLVFVLGGVMPLVWFMVSRWFHLKPAQTRAETFAAPPSVLAMSGPLHPLDEAELAGSERQDA